jgi:hypothetical protein
MCGYFRWAIFLSRCTTSSFLGHCHGVKNGFHSWKPNFFISWSFAQPQTHFSEMGLQIKKWPSWHPLETQVLFCCSWWLIKCWDWLLVNVYINHKMVNNVHFYCHCYTKKVECAPYRCQIGFFEQQYLGNNLFQIVFSFYQGRFWA